MPRTDPLSGLHDIFPGCALAYRTLATLTFGRALLRRRHPAASAFLHREISFVCEEYTHWRTVTVQMKTSNATVTVKRRGFPDRHLRVRSAGRRRKLPGGLEDQVGALHTPALFKWMMQRAEPAMLI
jgi:hypothetical protein